MSMSNRILKAVGIEHALFRFQIQCSSKGKLHGFKFTELKWNQIDSLF